MIRSLVRLWGTSPVNSGTVECQKPEPEHLPMDPKVTSLADHQRICGEKAEAILGLALQLRTAIRLAPGNLPLPDNELDALLGALSAFIAASKRDAR